MKKVNIHTYVCTYVMYGTNHISPRHFVVRRDNQQKGEYDPRYEFMINLHESCVVWGSELETTGSAVTTHYGPTDCAMEPDSIKLKVCPKIMY